MDSRLWIVCYDVRDARRLRKVAKLMENYGIRAQKSVFECWLTPDRLARMHEQIQAVIDAQADSVRCYTLCENCRDWSERQGNTKIQGLEQYYLV